MASAAPARSRGRPPKEAGWQNQIPPDLFDSAVYYSLGPLHRILLPAMIAKADRHGRGLALPSKLRSVAFDGLPVTDEQTGQVFAELEGLLEGSLYEIRRYEVDRNPYWCFTRWLEWQNIEYLPQTSRFPAPPDDGSEPPSTPPRPDGSADLPPGPGRQAAGVPTTGAAPAGEAATVPTVGADPQGEEQQAGADPAAVARERKAAIEQARRSPEYREYEEACREAELDRWLTPMAFETLFAACLETKRDWRVAIEVVRETGRGAAGGRAPSPRYGAKIIRELPQQIRTRGEAKAHLEDPNRKPSGTGNGPPQSRAKPRSNVFLDRPKKDEGYYDHIYKKFGDDKPPPEAPEVN